MDSETADKLKLLLKAQKYHLIGSHSAVKSCRWLHEALVNARSCYKQRFYGIKTHRCIQMTPMTYYCNLRCRFCWRIQSGDKPNLTWKETSGAPWDEPERIVDSCIEAQRKILTGYRSNPRADMWKLTEALRPKHVAISLTGEPTFYPYLGDLIELFHKRGFTTFMVSNGTTPEALLKLTEEPTQLYISLCAYDEQTFLKTCRPQLPNAWTKLNETLSILSNFKCPTVLRLTLARHHNLAHPELYARLVQKANPTYVEPKGYMHVGFSRLRLGYENMPSHGEIRSFAKELADLAAYSFLDEAPESCVVLLSRLEKAIRLV